MAGALKMLDVYLPGNRRNKSSGISKVGSLRLAFEHASWTSRMYRLQVHFNNRRIQDLLNERGKSSSWKRFLTVPLESRKPR